LQGTAEIRLFQKNLIDTPREARSGNSSNLPERRLTRRYFYLRFCPKDSDL